MRDSLSPLPVMFVTPDDFWTEIRLARCSDCPCRQSDEALFCVEPQQQFLRHCLGCPHLREALAASQTPQMAEAFGWVIDELLEERARLQSLHTQVDSRNREIRFLHEISMVLQTSMELDEVIAMALTAITSGKGFGINRAILLLVDPERHNLRGHFAVGPRSAADGAKIWGEIEEKDQSLKEMADSLFEQKMTTEKDRFRDLLEELTISLEEKKHLFLRALSQPHALHLPQLHAEGETGKRLAKLLGSEEVVLVPLLSHKQRIGLLIADNIVNRRPITAEDMTSLETFAQPLAFAIERASLYTRLRQKLDQITEANQRLKSQQETIVRMEKMALAGKIAANLAHSIRNPLTIIGGYVRTLLRQTPAQDQRHDGLETILRETGRLEAVLQEVLQQEESHHPSLDRWDINRLLAEVHAELKEELTRHGLSCDLQLASDLPQLRFDYKKIGYCLRTLTLGIIQSSAPGGDITLKTFQEENTLRITLNGHGPLLDPLPKSVLNCFQPAVETQSPLFTLCRRILAEHGARLETGGDDAVIRYFSISLQTPWEEPHATTADR